MKNYLKNSYFKVSDFVSNGEYEKAVSIYTGLVEKIPEKPFLKALLAHSILGTLKFNQAKEILEELLNNDFSNEEKFNLFLMLAYCYLLLNDKNSLLKMKQIAENMIEINNKSDVAWNIYGTVLIELNDVDKGLEILVSNNKGKKGKKNEKNYFTITCYNFRVINPIMWGVHRRRLY